MADLRFDLEGLQEERAWVDERLAALRAFINGPDFEARPSVEREYLRMQHHLTAGLSEVLTQRIALIPPT